MAIGSATSWAGRGLGSRLPIVAWVMTTMLGVLIFAWVVRRPQRDADPPLAAALSMVAEDRPSRTAGARYVPRRVPGLSGHGAADRTARSPTDPPAGRPGRPCDSPRPRPATWSGASGVRLVRLSGAPDDVASREFMRLDRGDEVENVEGRSCLQVRTPTGEISWIPSVADR